MQVTLTTLEPSSTTPFVSEYEWGLELKEEVPKSAITLGVLAFCVVLGICLSRAAERFYDSCSVRDDASDMSEHTRELLKARLATFAFLKKPKLDGLSEKKRAEEYARKYGRLWLFRVAMNNRRQQRAEHEQARKEKEQQKGFFGKLFGGRSKSSKASTSKKSSSKITSSKESNTLSPKKTVTPPLKSVPLNTNKKPSAVTKESPAKSAPIQTSTTSSPSPKKFTRKHSFVAKDSLISRAIKEEDFISIEISHADGSNKQNKELVSIDPIQHCGIDNDAYELDHISPKSLNNPTEIVIHNATTNSQILTVHTASCKTEDTFSVISSEEFNISDAIHTESDKQSTSEEQKTNSDHQAKMSKYIRPPTRDGRERSLVQNSSNSQLPLAKHHLQTEIT